MKIHTEVSSDSNTLTISLSGKFDYTCHESFIQSFESVSPGPAQYVIDAIELVSLDSSALGMLLLLRNHAGGDDSHIRIVNASPEVCRLLSSCRFTELFNVEPLQTH